MPVSRWKGTVCKTQHKDHQRQGGQSMRDCDLHILMIIMLMLAKVGSLCKRLL